MKQIHKVSSKVSRGLPGDIAGTHRSPIFCLFFTLFLEAFQLVHSPIHNQMCPGLTLHVLSHRQVSACG